MEVEKAIELIAVTKDYPGLRAVEKISFSVRAHTIHGFLGPNGAGKSTTMRMIAGLLAPSEGQIRIQGKSPAKNSFRIGYLPENPPLYHNMTVESYLRFVAEINGVAKANLASAVETSMTKTGILDRRHRLIGHLSKGYKQRVGIAGCIVFSPAVVILDEPTVGLDPHSIEEIRELIKSLKQDATVMLSTHQLNEAHLLCDEVTIIDRGQVVQSGSVSQLQHHFQTRQVVKAVVAHWSDEIQARLQELEHIEKCEVSYIDNHIALKIFASSHHDIRSLLASFLVINECQLLQLSELQLDLEDIFKLATAREAQ